jgi:RimJ/RimL family protein N-acetyltransferase
VIDDLDLMKLRAEIDFTYDARGRMLLTGEPCVNARRPSPRFTIGRARGGHTARFGAALPDVSAQALQRFVDRLEPVEALHFPEATLDVLREMLGGPESAGGPAYRFPDVIATSGEAIRLTDENRELAKETFPWLYEEVADWQPCFVVVQDGAVVSACYSSRIGPLAAEAGLDTLAEFRGRGYAAAVTAAWGSEIRAMRRIPIYSTGWSNLASQGVARRVGLKLFGTDATWE